MRDSRPAGMPEEIKKGQARRVYGVRRTVAQMFRMQPEWRNYWMLCNVILHFGQIRFGIVMQPEVKY